VLTFSLKEVVMDKKVSGELVVKDICRRTPKKYYSEEKIPLLFMVSEVRAAFPIYGVEKVILALE
jgi:hypothetical protein